MKNFLKHLRNKDRLFLIAVLVFAFVIRVFFLGRFPIGITHDELNNVLSAKSIFWAHSFAPGTAPAILPTSMSNFTVTVPEVPTIILAALIGPFPLSLFSARIVGAILSMLSVLAVYFIALHIAKKKIFAQICAILMAINPWSILLGRTIAELNFFVAFFLWGFLIMIKSKGWRIFRALPFYLLGFFSYTGGQISFFIFIVATLVYHCFVVNKDRKELKIYIIFSGLISIIFAGYIFVAMQNQSFSARGKELYLPSLPEISTEVNLERRLAIPTPINNLFINKATVYVRGFVSKYINTFSPNYLFLNGEARAIFSYQTHGTFYLIDFLFILIGFSSLFVLNKKGWILFIAIIIGCSVTAGLSVVESSYSQRVGLIYPFLVMLSGIGVGSVISAAKSNKTRKILSFVLTIFYLISLINLLFIYFIRFPIYASDGWFFQDRVLSSYIAKTEEVYPDTKIIVYTPEPKIIFEEHLFYTSAYDQNKIGPINKRLDMMNYSINNVTFTDKCPDASPDRDSVIVFDGTFPCNTLSHLIDLVHISRLKDVYANYLIYNDKLCSGLELNRYIPLSAYKDFSIEKQPPNKFCLNWITRIKE